MLLEKRHTYKPFKYPFAYEAWEQHERIHWMGSEVPLGEDVNDWRNKLSTSQKEFLTQLFRFFTTADVCVAEAYNSKFLPLFCGNPEVAMMMDSFAAREAVHVQAYSLLVDTVGMPETEYGTFLQYKAMKDKYDFLENVDISNNFNIAKSLAIYSGFTEGVQLFASFAMLIHFERMGLMKGMANIVRWSLRDEGCHADNMLSLYNVFKREYIDPVELPLLESQILSVADVMVDLEDKFIDLAFGVLSEEDLNSNLPEGEERLCKDKLKMYTRHMTDHRLKQMGIKPIYGIDKTPLPWLDRLLLAPEHTNFFEARPTEYSKGGLKGSIEY